MSRIGRLPIPVPKGVDVKLTNNVIAVKGPRGTLERRLHPDMGIALNDGVITVSRPTDNKNHRSLHGLTRALINNMVVGVTDGFKKELEISGVGFKAEMRPRGLLLNVGYTHGVFIVPPPGVKIEVPKITTVVVSGNDAELVGHVAAEIRDVRKPEPYKGKGIRYSDEIVKRKAGKTAKK